MFLGQLPLKEGGVLSENNQILFRQRSCNNKIKGEGCAWTILTEIYVLIPFVVMSFTSSQFI